MNSYSINDLIQVTDESLLSNTHLGNISVTNAFDNDPSADFSDIEGDNLKLEENETDELIFRRTKQGLNYNPKDIDLNESFLNETQPNGQEPENSGDSSDDETESSKCITSTNIQNYDEEDDVSEATLAQESRLIQFRSSTSQYNWTGDWSIDTIFCCYVCSTPCDGFGPSVTHIRKCHPDLIEKDKSAHCIVCPKLFARRDHLKNHLWRHVNRVRETPRHSLRTFKPGRPAWCEMRDWTCRRCSTTVRGISDFVTHLEVSHQKECGIVCPECDKVFPSKKRLKVHMVLHSERKFPCENCSKSFSEEYKLRRHVKEVHEGLKEHVCATCGKGFARADKLFQHELVHVDKSDRPVEWVPIQSNLPIPEIADDSSSDESSDTSSDESVEPEKEFVEQANFPKEIKDESWTTSTPIDSFDDDFLNFIDNEDPTTTIELKHPRKRGRPKKVAEEFNAGPEEEDPVFNSEVECHICSIKFRGFDAAVVHMCESHRDSENCSPEKVFMCVLCSKSFARMDQLRGHFQRHYSKEKRRHRSKRSKGKHKVQFIVKEEASDVVAIQGSGGAASHVWSERMGWPCKRCDLQFKGITNYVEHLEDIHTDDGAISCPFCEPETFQSKRELRRHVVIHHMDGLPDSTPAEPIKITIKKETLDDSRLETENDLDEKKSEFELNIGDHFLLNHQQSDDDFGPDGGSFCNEDEFVSFIEENNDKGSENEEESGLIDVNVDADVEVDVDDADDDDDDEGSDDGDNDDIEEEESDQENDFEPRKRGRPRKLGPKMKRKRLSGDKELISNHVFHCFICQVECKGYNAAVSHMAKTHEVDGQILMDGTRQHQCINCPKLFGRRDHLKRHMIGHHVEARMPRQRGRRPKEIEDEGLFDIQDIPDDVSAGINDESPEAQRRLRKFKRKRIGENKSILESIDKAANGNPPWSESEQFICYLCKSVETGVEASIKHMSKTHPTTDSGFQCIMCPRVCDSLELLKVHLWRHLNSIAQPLVRSTAPRIPAKVWAELFKWTCQKCLPLEFEIVGLDNLIAHMKEAHNSGSGLVCPICDKDKFSKKEQLRFHIQGHSEPKQPCEFCGKLFAAGNKMKRHVAEVHEGRKNHMCNTCGKCFARSEKLRAHEIVHLPVEHKPFLCHQCGRGFGRQEHVSRHAKICGQKKTRIKQALFKPNANPFDKELARVAVEYGLEYLQKEAGTGLFHCTKCPRHSKEKRSIIEHYARAHCVEHMNMPHSCDECGRGFKVIKDLMKHKKKPHTVEYLSFKYPCPIDKCGKRFRKDQSLKRHMLLHEGVRPFKCDHCDQAFHIKQVLKRHMMLIHKIKAPREIREKKSVDLADSQRRTKSIPGGKKKLPRDDLGSIDEDDLIDDKHREHQLAELHHHLLKVTSGHETGGALNLSQNNQEGTSGQQGHNSVLSDQQQQQQQWMTQGLQGDYFSGPSGAQFPFAHWMSVGLDQPSPLVTSGYSFMQGQRDVEQDEPSRSYTPAESVHSSHTDHLDALPVSSPTSQPHRDIFETSREWEETSWDQPPQKMSSSVQASEDTSSSQQQVNNCDAIMSDARRKRKLPPILSEEEKLEATTVMESNKLGVLCNVCGKMLKSKDALNFHIMNTKLPGHEAALQQLIKNNFAQESMRLSAKLTNVTRKDSNEDLKNQILQTIPPSPMTPYGTSELIDPETGIIVKKEPMESSSIADSRADSSESLNIRLGQFKEESQGSNSDASTLMPPPNSVPPKKLSKNKIFKCCDCHRAFKKVEKLVRHVTKKHNKPAKSSNRQSNILKQQQVFVQKVLEQHQIKEQSQQCDDDEDDDAANVKMEKPDDDKDGPASERMSLKLTPMGCPDCTMIFTSKEEMVDHFQKEPHNMPDSATGNNRCPVLTCFIGFSTRKKLIQHLRIGKHVQPCPRCAKTFKKMDQLEIHVRSHYTDRPYLCSRCDKSFKDAITLGSHMVVHSDKTRPFLCSDCGAGFMKSDHLKRHINTTHLKIKNVKCQFCEKWFGDKYKAKIHERMHTGEAPYLCSICAKAFKRKEALEHHSVVHKKDLLPKDFKCVTCGNTFISQQYLNRHVSRHFATKKHKCRFCSMAFIDRRDYLVHVSHVHEGQRPYICPTCNCAYKTKQGLTTHNKAYPNGDCINAKRDDDDMLIDEKELANLLPFEKPFECPHCSKRFVKKSRLEWHLRMHNNERPFPCTEEGCNKAFFANQTLRAHLRQVHHANLPPLRHTGPRPLSPSNKEPDPLPQTQVLPPAPASASEEREHLVPDGTVSGRESVLSNMSQSSVRILDQHQNQNDLLQSVETDHQQRQPIADAFQGLSRRHRLADEVLQHQLVQQPIQQHQTQPRSFLEHRQQLMEAIKDVRNPSMGMRTQSSAVTPVQPTTSIFPTHSFVLQQQHERHVQEQLLLQQQHQQQQQRLQQQQQRHHQMQQMSSLQHVATQPHHHLQTHMGGVTTPIPPPSPTIQQQQHQQDLQAALGFYHFANFANLNQIYRN